MQNMFALVTLDTWGQSWGFWRNEHLQGHLIPSMQCFHPCWLETNHTSLHEYRVERGERRDWRESVDSAVFSQRLKWTHKLSACCCSPAKIKVKYNILVSFRSNKYKCSYSHTNLLCLHTWPEATRLILLSSTPSQKIYIIVIT